MVEKGFAVSDQQGGNALLLGYAQGVDEGLLTGIIEVGVWLVQHE